MPLPKSPPATNKAAADKNKAANAIHMQDQFKAGAAPQDTSSLQKLGAAFTGEQRSQDVQASGAEAAKAVEGIGREQKAGELEQSEQNIKDQEQLNKSIESQKSALIDMDIGITEDEFADEMTIKTLNEQQDFQNETQLMDLARLAVDSDEEFLELSEESYQRTTRQLKEDEWELDVYDRIANDKALSKKIAADASLSQEIDDARRAAEEKAAQSKAKAAKQGKALAATKVVVGAAAMYSSGGTVGSNLVVEGGLEATA